MDNRDALQFVQERLRHHHQGPLTRDLGLRRRPRVLRRHVVALGKGQSSVLERVDRSVEVRCERGSLWITHDGDCKDVVLAPGQSYQAERDERMHLFALAPCVLEIEFEDEVLT
ncbi:MAG TPA: DUF2917 domain-containing protein [Ramlibacter sp.]|nr:DUF2917 domain-containing protein [Ramlibacter sp.]